MSGPSTIDGLSAATNGAAGELPIWQTASTFKLAVTAAIVAFLMNTPRAVITTGTVTLAATDRYVPVNPAAAVTLNPPASPLDGQELIIKDIGGAAGTNNITLAAGFGSIDGTTGRKISTNYGWFRIRYDAAQTKWFQV